MCQIDKEELPAIDAAQTLLVRIMEFIFAIFFGILTVTFLLLNYDGIIKVNNVIIALQD